MEYIYEIGILTSDIGENFYANLAETELDKFIIENPTTLNQSITFDRGEDIEGETIFIITIEYEN